jgi:hypothetical protein
MQYVIDRAKEPSTWRGIILLITLAGWQLQPDMQEAIITAGVALAGVVGVAFPDVKKKTPAAQLEAGAAG